MLKVGVHHGDVACLARQHALDAGAREAAPANAAHAAHARIAFADLAGDRSGAVGRIVVDEHDLPIDTVKSVRKFLDQQRNVVVLLEGRDHDRQFGRAPRCRKLPLCRRCVDRPSMRGRRFEKRLGHPGGNARAQLNR